MLKLRATTTIIFFCTSLVLSGCEKQQGATVTAEAQTAPVKEPVQPAPEAPRKKNFDLNSTVLHTDFVPDSPIDVYDGIRRLHLSSKDKFESDTEYLKRLKLEAFAKDKFESDLDYQKRVNSGSSRKLFDDVELGGGFAFKVPKRSGYRPDVTYDPVRKGFTFELPLAICAGDWNCVEIDTQTARSLEYSHWDRYYAAEQARTITHRKTVELKISALNGQYAPEGFYKAAPDVARTIDQNLDLVLVGRIVPPYSATDQTLPSRDNEMIHRSIIHFSATGIWLVNRKSGEILLKTLPTKRKR